MMDGEFGLPGLIESSTSVSITSPDGAKAQQSHSLDFAVAPGFLPIEEFTKLHMGELEALFVAIVNKLMELKFSIAPIKPAGEG